ncbi:rod shape-determining protein MreC [Paenibacillus lemnae]|uniref:Cell shape-determining protein MreC n=1 Tax=Paenibacillus lemnae TaxID=1330551 RepID=A0A848M4W7_PAELE|nr:rod shape-determining protein MreC [Paenibacillus lemnae]NMO95309.1 rod shape-determining protein MreC [Paenibacillus lemnae]
MLIGLVTFIALMGFTLGPRVGLTWPEKFVRDSVGFVQGVFYKPASYIAGFFEDVRSMKEVYAENERLKKAVAQYARESAEYHSIKTENETYMNLLKFTEAQKGKYDYDFRPANVLSVNQDPNNHTLVIDLGSKDGVRANMSVTSVEGMVGVISQVGNFTSTVKLLTTLDPQDAKRQQIAATVSNKDTFGIIESYDKQTKMLKMTRIPEDDPVKDGDLIVSSGSGGVIPRGMIIGKVDKVEDGEFGLTRTATIDPAASFQEWKTLLVVFTPEEPQE